MNIVSLYCAIRCVAVSRVRSDYVTALQSIVLHCRCIVQYVLHGSLDEQKSRFSSSRTRKLHIPEGLEFLFVSECQVPVKPVTGQLHWIAVK